MPKKISQKKKDAIAEVMAVLNNKPVMYTEKFVLMVIAKLNAGKINNYTPKQILDYIKTKIDDTGSPKTA